ncbi:MAG: tRNA uracil 4-sulfurtransferase ThiI [Longimicrobiales bacterium]
MERLILVRLGSELTLKSRRTRYMFLQRLRRNLEDALASAGLKHRVSEQWGRMYVRAESPAALSLISRVFGISSCSLIEGEVPARIDTIVERGQQLFRERVAGRRFAVRTHRVGQHDFRSHDIDVQLGAALLPLAAGVDLGHPEVTVHVEIRADQAYLFSQRTQASGGLPIGVEGRAVALVSGGYDSAVAAWLMLKRGVELDYVFCNLGGAAYERAVVHVAKALAEDWSYGTRPKLHVIDFAECLRELRATVRSNYLQVVLKRLMYRSAAAISHQHKAIAIVTGEAIGQVSSQTLHNLRAIEPASDLPVLRPLLGFDKEEIIARARAIGTAALSEQVKEYCAIAPGKPVTATTPERIAQEEAPFPLAVLEQAIAQRKVLDLRALNATDLAAPYLFTTSIPDGAIVIDCRPEPQYQAWHMPGSIQREEWDLLHEFKRLDKNRKYVLYCAHGIQTAYLAEKMQNAGFEAYSFRGGLKNIMRYAERQENP